MKVHGVIGSKRALLVNLAAVRRKKNKKITEEEGKTDKQPTRIEAEATGAGK